MSPFARRFFMPVCAHARQPSVAGGAGTAPIPMRLLKYCVPFVFLATAPLGFVLGGGWSFLTVAIVPAAICGLDRALGFEPAQAAQGDAPSYRMLPWLYI